MSEQPIQSPDVSILTLASAAAMHTQCAREVRRAETAATIAVILILASLLSYYALDWRGASRTLVIVGVLVFACAACWRGAARRIKEAGE